MGMVWRGALILAAGLAACHLPNPECVDGVCACHQDGGLCDLGCPARGCDLECRHQRACNLDCFGNCTAECSDTTTCAMNSGNNADLTCQRVETCTAFVGTGSRVVCQDVKHCLVELNSGTGEVTCTRVEQCDVVCRHTARAARDCGGGVFACHLCPPPGR